MKDNKCPSCGGRLQYNPNTLSLSCEYCGGTYKIDEMPTLNLKKDYTPNVTFREVNKSQYLCESCGSHINFDGTQDIKRCPNCGSISLQKTSFVSYEPDGIVPFSIGKDKAKTLFYEWIKKRKFAPRDLKKMAKMGKLTGFYTPVWNFDGNTITSYSGYGVDVHRDREGHSHTSRTPISGEQRTDYQNILFSANTNVDMKTIQKLGDWGLLALKVYSLDYLCGFIGTDVNIDIHNSYQSFTGFVKSGDEYRIRRRYMRYDRLEGLKCHTTIYNPKFNYIYLPLWVNYYTYKDKKYSCYINGYSGAVTGSAPKSFWKIFLLVSGIVLGAILLGTLIATIVSGSIPYPNSNLPDWANDFIPPDWVDEFNW